MKATAARNFSTSPSIYRVMLMRIILLVALSLALGRPMAAAPAPPSRAKALFFIAHDCPIANGYAPEIRRNAAQYGPRGVRCVLVYAEAGLTPAAARRHAAAYGYHLPTMLDPRLTLAHRMGATVTPEAVVVGPTGRVLYRGRIDDKYVTLGQPRYRVTRHDLRDALDAVVQGRPVAVATTPAIGCAISPG